MLSKNEVLTLRELALDHLPETRALSEKMYKEHHNSRAALQAVAWAPTLAINSPLSSPVEKQAGILLNLVGKHPETHTEHLNDAVDGGNFSRELTAILLADAHRDREQTEINLLAVTRELCHLSGTPLPPWFPVEIEHTPELPAVENTQKPKETRTIKHSLKNRVSILDTEIKMAMKLALNPTDPHSVWAELTKLAQLQTGVMIGFSSDGIQYRGKKYQSDEVPDVFTLKMLRDRMRTKKSKTK